MLLPRSAITLANSRYFTSGLISAVGVALLGFATYAVAGLGPAVALGSGALAVCFADNPAPLRLKMSELLFTSLISTVALALVSASLWLPAVQVGLIPLLGFASGMIAAWGKRALAFSFSVLFISVITLGTPPLASWTAWAAAVALYLAGALLYTGYALLLTRLLRLRTKHQALGELFAQLAQYARWRSQEHGRRGAAVSQAVALLTAVNDTLQNTRDLVLRDLVTEADHALVGRLLQALEIIEALIASQSDVELMLTQYDATAVPDALRDWTRQLADALDAQAMALLRGRPVRPAPADLGRADAAIIDDAVQNMRPRAASAAFEQARMALRTRAADLRRITEVLQADESSTAQQLQHLDLDMFVSPLRYHPRVLLKNLHWHSPILRYSIRLALALLAGGLLSHLLPYGAHTYWVLLTIGVILRPNFSVTRRRIKDRVLGTLLGCGLVAALLTTHPDLWVMAAGVFVSLIFARTFITLNYRFTALSASVNALLLVALLEPGSKFLITQRLIDTLLGAAVAWSFSFVLPRWEARDMQRQMRLLLRAALAYAEAVLDPAKTNDGEYRTRRKALFDALAAVGGLHARMLEEPVQKQRHVQELGACIGHCYVLSAHLATLRVLRAQRGESAPAESVRPLFASTLDGLRACLAPEHAVDCAAWQAPSQPSTPASPVARRLAEIATQAQSIARLTRILLGPPARAA